MCSVLCRFFRRERTQHVSNSSGDAGSASTPPDGQNSTKSALGTSIAMHGSTAPCYVAVELIG